MATALIFDDDEESLLALSEIFRQEGYSTETCRTISSARESLLRRMPEIAMLSEQVAGQNTLDLLEELDLSRVMEIYLMSAQRTLATATRAMKLGVSGYFERPVNRQQVLDSLREVSDEVFHPADATDLGKSGRGLLIGESPPMHRLYRLIRKSAPSKATILLAGESGSGKELVAQTIHALSQRSSSPFIPLNCSAISSELMESELFGHKKGSFTGATRDHKGFFERAAGGTLFLDELTEMAVPLQAKLLRVLESKSAHPVGSEKAITLDARIIAATNRDPQTAISEGKLREDLYFRLAQFPLRVPPLRERGSDIDLLAEHFLAEQNAARGLDKTLTEESREALRLHDWPGNVRELRNTILQGHLLSGSAITLDDLPDGLPSTQPVRGHAVRTQMGMSLAAVERRHLLATLAHMDGDKKRAAKILGISLKTLYNRLKKYGVD